MSDLHHLCIAELQEERQNRLEAKEAESQYAQKKVIIEPLNRLIKTYIDALTSWFRVSLHIRI